MRINRKYDNTLLLCDRVLMKNAEIIVWHRVFNGLHESRQYSFIIMGDVESRVGDYYGN